MESRSEKFNNKYGNRSKIEKTPEVPVIKKEEQDPLYDENVEILKGFSLDTLRSYRSYTRKLNKGEVLSDKELKKKEIIEGMLRVKKGGTAEKLRIEFFTEEFDDSLVREFPEAKEELLKRNEERAEKAVQKMKNTFASKKKETQEKSRLSLFQIKNKEKKSPSSIDTSKKEDTEGSNTFDHKGIIGTSHKEDMDLLKSYGEDLPNVYNGFLKKIKEGEGLTAQERSQKDLIEKIRGIKKEVPVDNVKSWYAQERFQELKNIEVLKRRSENLSKRLEVQKNILKNLRKPEEIKHQTGAIKVMQERIAVLKERSKNLEKRKLNYQERNDKWWKKLASRTGRNWGSFKQWYEKPGNKEKMLKRVAIGVVASGTMGVFGIGAGVVAGGVGSLGGFFGDGFGKRMFERFGKKDFREDLFKLRREGLQNEIGTQSKYKERIKKLYDGDKNDLTNAFLKRIKREDLKKTVSGMLGALAFAGLTRSSVTSLMESFDGDLPVRGLTASLGENVKVTDEIVTNTDIGNQGLDKGLGDGGIPEDIFEKKNVVTGSSKVNLENIYINKGEGVTHSFIRQIRASEALQNYFKLGENFSESELIKAAAEAARETGYLSDTQEVRVLLGEGAGYELKIDGNGLVVNEYTGIAEVNGSLKGGEVFETHRSGDTFEGGDHEVSREYITGAGSVEDTGNRIGEIQGSYIGDTLEDYHDVEVGSEDALDYHDVEVDSTEAHLEGGYVGKELPDYKSFFSENRKYNSLPGVRGLDGTYLSQKSLSSQFNKIVIPQEIINLFQNPARISTFVRFDDRVLEVLGLELNNLPGKDKLDVFKMKGTNEGVSWKDIYEKVDLSKVKRAIENLKS